MMIFMCNEVLQSFCVLI